MIGKLFAIYAVVRALAGRPLGHRPRTATSDLIDALNGVRVELERQRDLIAAARRVEISHMAALVAGQIGNQGVAPRRAVAGSGSVARY